MNLRKGQGGGHPNAYYKSFINKQDHPSIEFYFLKQQLRSTK